MLHSSPAAAKASCNPGETFESLSSQEDSGSSLMIYGEVVDTYFHREELEDKAGRDADDDQEMSTDTEAAVTVR